MGGLLAARALSDTYPEVLLLDRDALPAAPASLIAYGMSRPLLEHVVRERVTTLPGVRVLAGHEVTGLLTTPDRRQVVGVQVAAGAAAHPEPGAAGAARPARRLRHGTAPSRTRTHELSPPRRSSRDRRGHRRPNRSGRAGRVGQRPSASSIAR